MRAMLSALVAGQSSKTPDANIIIIIQQSDCTCHSNNTSIIIVRVENQKEKNMEHAIESQVYKGLDRLPSMLVVRVVEFRQPMGGFM